MNLFNNVHLFSQIAENWQHHARTENWWTTSNDLSRSAILGLKPNLEAESQFSFGPIQQMCFSYFEMGAINSLDLFGLDELIIFSFYWQNRNRYSSIADIGANIGLHSVILGHMSYSVTSFEPDPIHVLEFSRNIQNNLLTRVNLVSKAVTVDGGNVAFTRVLGNTTGSHVTGAKSDPYGELEQIEVAATPFRDLLLEHDLIKLDVEGFEANLLTSVSDNELSSTDVIGEIGSTENAERIFQRFEKSSINLFSQKNNWEQVRDVDEMPTSHRDGSFFLSIKPEMPWN
jgi:FkbM family methyltransferase